MARKFTTAEITFTSRSVHASTYHLQIVTKSERHAAGTGLGEATENSAELQPTQVQAVPAEHGQPDAKRPAAHQRDGGEQAGGEEAAVVLSEGVQHEERPLTSTGLHRAPDHAGDAAGGDRCQDDVSAAETPRQGTPPSRLVPQLLLHGRKGSADAPQTGQVRMVSLSVVHL